MNRRLSVALGLTAAATWPGAARAADDRYLFADGASAAATLTLAATSTGAQATWTAPATAKWDTALLGVQVNPSPAGPGGDAWIDVAAGGGRVRQHLDRGASGLRWLNVSPLRGRLAGAGTVVAFTAHGTTLRPGPAPVRLFANEIHRGRPLLVLAPHPDDAEIAAFGLYAGQPATIVTVTAGNAGDANYKDDFPDAAEQYAFKGYLRALDSVTVPWQGGIPPQRCFNLGYFDARLQEMHDKPQTVFTEMYGPNQDVSRYRRVNLSRLLPSSARTATWAHLVDDLVQLLRKVHPAVIVMPHPILDGHSDHDYVTVATAEALQRWTQPVTVLLYTNHVAENLYPYGPAATCPSSASTRTRSSQSCGAENCTRWNQCTTCACRRANNPAARDHDAKTIRAFPTSITFVAARAPKSCSSSTTGRGCAMSCAIFWRTRRRLRRFSGLCHHGAGGVGGDGRGQALFVASGKKAKGQAQQLLAGRARFAGRNHPAVENDGPDPLKCLAAELEGDHHGRSLRPHRGDVQRHAPQADVDQRADAVRRRALGRRRRPGKWHRAKANRALRVHAHEFAQLGARRRFVVTQHQDAAVIERFGRQQPARQNVTGVVRANHGAFHDGAGAHRQIGR
jgi:LmbE family N-acetylglucosaminyl deacetylase